MRYNNVFLPAVVRIKLDDASESTSKSIKSDSNVHMNISYFFLMITLAKSSNRTSAQVYSTLPPPGEMSRVLPSLAGPRISPAVLWGGVLTEVPSDLPLRYLLIAIFHPRRVWSLVCRCQGACLITFRGAGGQQVQTCRSSSGRRIRRVTVGWLSACSQSPSPASLALHCVPVTTFPSATPMDVSTPGFPVLHDLPEFAQTHLHWVSDAIQPSHPLSPPSPPAFNLCHHQSLSQWISSSHPVAQVLAQHPSWSRHWIKSAAFCLIIILSSGFLVVQCLRICLPMQGARFSPWLGKIPHAVGQLSPGTTTTEALACLCSAAREVATVRSLRTSTRE